MESSMKVFQVILPKNQDSEKKIILNTECQNTQVGDHNKAIVESKIIGETEDAPNVVRFELDDIGSDENKFTIEGEIVQVLPSGEYWPDNVYIKSNSNRENSTLQIGNKTELKFQLSGDVAKPEASSRRPKYHRSQTKKKRNSKKKRVENPPGNYKFLPTSESKELYDNFFRVVLAVLHPLRDDGKWDEFEEKLNEFRVRYGSDPVWDILLTLEQGQQICYHSYESNIENAEKKLYEGLEKCKNLVKDPSISQLCQGRGYLYLTSIYRRVYQFIGKAQKCITKAEKYLKDTNFLYDQASLYYEKASLLLEFDRKGSHAKEIETCLDKCSELCDEIKKDENWDFVKKGYFAKVKKVMLLCDCSTKPVRKRTINNEDLEEAKRCLKELDEENKTRSKERAVSEQIVHLLAISDTKICCKEFHEAKEIAEQAFALAKRHGFDEKTSNNNSYSHMLVMSCLETLTSVPLLTKPNANEYCLAERYKTLLILILKFITNSESFCMNRLFDYYKRIMFIYSR